MAYGLARRRKPLIAANGAAQIVVMTSRILGTAFMNRAMRSSYSSSTRPILFADADHVGMTRGQSPAAVTSHPEMREAALYCREYQNRRVESRAHVILRCDAESRRS